MTSARIVVAVCVVASAGCSAELAFDVSFESAASCTADSTGAVVAIETGECANASGQPVWSLDFATDVGDPPELAPGAYCFSAGAYRTGELANGNVCRFDAFARETRTVPRQPKDVRLEPACSEPTELTDELLENVVGCNPRCDVARCVCSGGCDPSCVGDACDSTCPSPVDLTNVVFTAVGACGLTNDRRFIVCWGEAAGEEGAAGVATPRFEAENEVTALVAGPNRICWRVAGGALFCDGAPISSLSETDRRGLFAVGTDFVCGGSALITCATPGDDGSAQLVGGFNTPSVLTSTGDRLCGLISGDVYCVRPAECRLRCNPPRIEGLGVTVELDASGERVCAISAVTLTLRCWSYLSDDPDGWTTSPLAVADLAASEVSVGTEHVCVRRLTGGVVCGRLEAEEGQLRMVSPQELASADVTVEEFVAGTSGVSCATVARPAQARRVECLQLPEFEPRPALLGRAHTRDFDPSGDEPDFSDRAVCP